MLQTGLASAGMQAHLQYNNRVLQIQAHEVLVYCQSGLEDSPQKGLRIILCRRSRTASGVFGPIIPATEKHYQHL